MQNLKKVLTMAIMGIALFPLKNHAQNWLTNGLVAYYPFNGNPNDAIGTNNGTVFGATLTANRFGEANRAYYFDGQSKILASDAMLPMGNSPRTISLWVKCLDSDTNRVYAIPFSYALHQPGQGCWLNVVTREDVLHRPAGSVFFDFYNTFTISSNRVVLNTWQQLICTIDDTSTARIFINGLLAGANLVNINTAPSGVMSMGDINPSEAGKAAVIGGVDDIRIYNRALSPSEVQQLYEYESGPRVGLIKAVKPSFSNLTISNRYQLQLSGDLNNWTNQGSAFTATNVSLICPQYWDVDNWGKLFFRLQVVP